MMSLAEQKVWDYIDGNLSSPEYERVRNLIAVDPVYSKLYDELTALNGSLNELDMDEPSMSFTRNVMQQLEHEAVPASLVDKRIIYGITAFFVLTITAIVVIMLLSITWTGGAATSSFQFKFPELNFALSLDSSLVRGFLLADVVIALYMLDSVLRKRLTPHQNA